MAACGGAAAAGSRAGARAAASQTFCLVWSSSAQPRPWKQITARVREESDMADTESFVMSTFFCNEDLSTPTIDEGNQDFDLEWEAGGTCIDDCDLTAYEACNPAFLTLSCLSDCDDQYVTEITEYISGGCIFAEYIGDGWCDADHFHNNAAQNFDGGDCDKCHINIDDVATWTLFDGTTCGECLDTGGDPSKIGDGVCDTQNKNSMCNYDGPDCTCSERKRYCNGICDEINNHPRCNFDGGDCVCPNAGGDFDISGNGVCDEKNNIIECDFDGGDCVDIKDSCDMCTHKIEKECMDICRDSCKSLVCCSSQWESGLCENTRMDIGIMGIYKSHIDENCHMDCTGGEICNFGGGMCS